MEVELSSLAHVFSQVTDPRSDQGKRHPLASILALLFLGLLGRIREMAVLQRWATKKWKQIRDPLGFDPKYKKSPHATTFSRVLSRCSVEEFSQAFYAWLRAVVLPAAPLTVAVDGKTSRQGYDTDGEPVQLLTVFAHRFKLVLAQWSVRGDKTNEPGTLRKHVEQLLSDYPLLRLVTGDAIFTQRPLAAALEELGCDYLLAIKENQKDMCDVVQQCLGAAYERPPAAQTAEKKGMPSIAANCGLI
jgi:hypothetical protein